MPDPALLVTITASWNYVQSNGPPASGFVFQTTNGRTLTFNNTDANTTDRTAFLRGLASGDTISANGVTWNVIGVTIATSTVAVLVAPAVQAPPLGGATTQFTLNSYSGSGVGFPGFVPIIPPPLIGNPPPPTFPPPTPPPIGNVPVGPLVGPAIAAAGVPPSTPGFVQPRFQPPGSATSPPANGYFPQFTTAPYAGFPNQPPNGVPIVFSNIFTIPTFASGVWTPHPPPFTVTTAVIAQQSHLLETEFVPQSLGAAATPRKPRGRPRRSFTYQPSA